MIIPFIENINFYELLKFIKLNESSEFNKDYIPVEYLQSDGNQYIITPFYYDEGGIGTPPIYNIKCRCCIDNVYSIFGMSNTFILMSTSAGRMRFFGYTERQKITTDIRIGTELNNWELLNKNLYCNGIIQNSTPDYFNNTYGFGGGDYVYLFCRTGPEDIGGNCKISNFYVSAKDPDTGTITEICDLVACIRKSDNKPGMYDRVSQTFLTNQGTGEFDTPVYGYLSGNPPFTFNSNGNPLADYIISGNTVQNGTPTPDNPIMPQGTGDLETVGATAGQYKIPISSANTTTPVYLGEVQTTRKIKKLVLTGEETYTKQSGKTLYSFNLLISEKAQTRDLIMCSHLPFSWSYSTTISIHMYANLATVFLNFGTDVMNAQPSGNTVAGLKEYLAAQYAAGTPVTIWYVLANEETGIVNEPLMKIGDYADTVSKAQTGVEIPTTNGSNTLTIDTTLQPSEVSIVYEK